MIDVLIIEDEKGPAAHLSHLLEKSSIKSTIVGVVASIKAAKEWLQQHKAPDLIFSDVHLTDGISFTIFDQMHVNAPIIFITAYDQYALQAFRYNSIDYLVKPVDETDLLRALEKFRQQTISAFDPKVLIHAFDQQSIDYQKRFMVTAGDHIKSIAAQDIAYFYGKDKYVYLITTTNERYLIDHSLAQLESMLDPHDFFRINRQFLIGFIGIVDMIAYSRGRVKVMLHPPSKEAAIVSIDRAAAFKSWLSR